MGGEENKTYEYQGNIANKSILLIFQFIFLVYLDIDGFIVEKISQRYHLDEYWRILDWYLCRLFLVV